MTDREREKRNQEIAERVISPPCETDEDVKARIDALRGSFDDTGIEGIKRTLTIAQAVGVLSRENQELRQQLAAAREALREVYKLTMPPDFTDRIDLYTRLRRIAEIAKGGRGGD